MENNVQNRRAQNNPVQLGRLPSYCNKARVWVVSVIYVIQCYFSEGKGRAVTVSVIWPYAYVHTSSRKFVTVAHNS